MGKAIRVVLIVTIVLSAAVAALAESHDREFQPGDVIEVVDPHMEMHRYGRVVEVYQDIAYGILFPGETEVHRWYVDFELRQATEADLRRHEDAPMAHGEAAAFAEGDVIEVIDPHMAMHRYGTVAEVYKEVAYGILFPGETEVHRWYVDFELQSARPENLEQHGGSTGPMDGHGERMGPMHN